MTMDVNAIAAFFGTQPMSLTQYVSELNEYFIFSANVFKRHIEQSKQLDKQQQAIPSVEKVALNHVGANKRELKSTYMTKKETLRNPRCVELTVEPYRTKIKLAGEEVEICVNKIKPRIAPHVMVMSFNYQGKPIFWVPIAPSNKIAEWDAYKNSAKKGVA